MGSWVYDKVRVKSLDFFEPCAKAAKVMEVVNSVGVPIDSIEDTASSSI